jgi:hypothetical protein
MTEAETLVALVLDHSEQLELGLLLDGYRYLGLRVKSEQWFYPLAGAPAVVRVLGALFLTQSTGRHPVQRFGTGTGRRASQ